MDASVGSAPWLARWDSRAGQRRWLLSSPVVTVGRTSAADVVLLDDPLVSRLHARLEQVGEHWTLVDDGPSRNGTWVRGVHVTSRVWLHDRDDVRVGTTVLVFCAPGQDDEPHTLVGERLPTVAALTPAQRLVVAALCRPYLEGRRYPEGQPYGGGQGVPATNAQIAVELHLSVDAVKTHLRAVAHRFGIDHLPQNEKRLRTAYLAIQLGLSSP